MSIFRLIQNDSRLETTKNQDGTKFNYCISNVKQIVCMLFLSHYVYTMLFSRWSTFGFCIVARQMRKRCGEWRWRPWTSCPTSNCRCQGDGSFSKGEDVTKCCCTQVHQRVDSVQLRLSWIWSCSFPQRSCCMLVADRHLRYSKDEGLFHELHVKPSSTLMFEKFQRAFFFLRSAQSAVCSFHSQIWYVLPISPKIWDILELSANGCKNFLFKRFEIFRGRVESHECLMQTTPKKRMGKVGAPAPATPRSMGLSMNIDLEILGCNSWEWFLPTKRKPWVFFPKTISKG